MSRKVIMRAPTWEEVNAQVNAERMRVSQKATEMQEAAIRNRQERDLALQSVTEMAANRAARGQESHAAIAIPTGHSIEIAEREYPETAVATLNREAEEQRIAGEKLALEEARLESVFACDVCKREFKTAGWLKRHRRVEHALR